MNTFRIKPDSTTAKNVRNWLLSNGLLHSQIDDILARHYEVTKYVDPCEQWQQGAVFFGESNDPVPLTDVVLL